MFSSSHVDLSVFFSITAGPILLSAIRKRPRVCSTILIVIPLYDMLVQTVWELVFSTGFFMRIRTDNSGRYGGYLCWHELRQNGDNL